MSLRYFSMSQRPRRTSIGCGGPDIKFCDPEGGGRRQAMTFWLADDVAHLEILFTLESSFVEHF